MYGSSLYNLNFSWYHNMTKHTILGALVLGGLTLASCSKTFEHDAPLYAQESTDTSLPIVYFRTSDFTVGNIASLGTIERRVGNECNP